MADNERVPITARCYCAGVVIQARLVEGLASARRCNCSYCRMRGAVAVAVSVVGTELQIVAGADLLTEYRVGSGVARHYFCSRCGIYTHHQRRSRPGQYGLNVACIEGMSLFDSASVPVNEGAHHPKDGGGGVAGLLTYRPIARDDRTPDLTPRLL